MEKRRAGNSGLQLSRIGLGTMTWGRDTDTHEAADQLRAYVDAGGNFLDTAALYGDGDSERVIGGLLNTLVPRESLVIGTKAGISIRDGVRTVNNSRSALIDELDRSLQRLGTDYVDLWQIHTWDSDNPIDETLTALDHAFTTGKARYVGISNFSGWQTAHAITRQTQQALKAPITTVQNEFSLLNRRAESEVLEAAVELGAGFLAWSPLGRGILTGKYRKGIPSDSRGATQHFAAFVEPYLASASTKIVDAVCAAADGLGYSPTEVALAWVRDTPGVTSAIVGARTGAQLRGALSSEEITIPEPIRKALSEISL